MFVARRLLLAALLVGPGAAGLWGMGPGQTFERGAFATPAPTPTPVVVTVGTGPDQEKDMKERERLGQFGKSLPAKFALPANDVESLLFEEYGSVFVARGGAVPPSVIVFRDENDVAAFQKSVETKTEMIGGMPMTLQSSAMKALRSAIDEAASLGLSITPRDTDAASRSYQEAVGLWASRVEPALDHWVRRKKISQTDADYIRSLEPYGQVEEVLNLEKRRIYFAKDLQKSIIYSVAPPGTSQHLSMLAFDVAEYGDSRVREILARYGWYQTVVSDLPHFTFLGISEFALKEFGLKKVNSGGRRFWVPDLP